MTVNQIYTIVNNIANQATGRTDLVVTDATFVSVGETVLSSEKHIDAFYKILVDRIGRTVLSLRSYETKNAAIAREPFEFGAMLQKISFTMPQAQENPTWYPLSKEHTDPFEKSTAVFTQVFFSDISTWEVPGTIPDVQLKSAFTNATSMAAFISGIFQSMQNSMNVAYENLSNIARASLIGEVLTKKGTVRAVNLLTDYNTETNESLTVASALRSPEFLRWAAMRIKLVSDQMQKMSVIFNATGQERHTPKEYQVFEVLSNFEAALDTYLQADTYHNELTKLQYYTTIQYWQASGQRFNFEDVSSINLTIPIKQQDGSVVNTQVQQSGIVAVIRDRDAVGTTIDNRRSKSIYNPHEEYTNYWEKAEIGYFRDASENCVVFYLEEVGASSQLSLDDI